MIYEKNHKIVLHCMIFIMTMLVLLAIPVQGAKVTNAPRYSLTNVLQAPKVKGTWKKNPKMFKQNGKTYVKKRWVNIDDHIYYFNSKGRLVTGWIVYRDHRYYVTSAGLKRANGWQKIGTSYYYFSKYGYVCTGRWVDGYWVNSSGQRTGRRLSQKAKEASYTAKVLNVPNIRQYPQLPTGCESVALTMVLKYYKFKLDKTTIASRYLPKSGSNFVTAFCGSPFSYSGAGIYAPGLRNTAASYLKAKKSSLKAYNVSGTSLKNLYKYIDDGAPVIVWNSMYMWNPIGSFYYYALGRRWTFYRYEHCVVLCGYNKKKDQVLVSDSLSGKVWRKRSSFESIYNKMGKMAVVIR